MMAFLDIDAPYATQIELIQSMKRSRLSDKRFCNLHLFCKEFTLAYIPPTTLPNMDFEIQQIMKRFNDIEFGFTRLYCGTQFMNYRWLLSELVIERKLTEYLPFIKTLKCKQRIRYYTDMLQCIKDYINSSNRFYTSRKISVSNGRSGF